MVSYRPNALQKDGSPDRSDAAGKASLRAAAIAAATASSWLSRQPVEFRRALLAAAELRRFDRGDRITGLDDEGSDLYFLFEGAVQAAIARADSEVVATHVIFCLEWFGEYGAVSGRHNVAEYRATVSSLVLVVPRAVLMRELQSSVARGAMIDLLLDALKTHVEMSGDLTGLRSEHRVRSKLHALAGGAPADSSGACVLRMSQDELADVACVSRSVVSKVMSQLAGEGIAQVGYRRIVILNRDALMAGSASARRTPSGQHSLG